MKVIKVITTLSLAIALTAGLTACFPGFTGSGVVVDKEIETSSSRSSKSKTTKRSTSYRLTLDRPDSDMDMIVGVPKHEYDRINVGDSITMKDGQVVR